MSSIEQNLDLQIDALAAAGCNCVFRDEGISGATFTRPGLAELLSSIKSGDTLTVWRLDRLGRSLFQLLALVRDLDERGIQFRSLSEGIDTGSSGGRLLFHLLAAMAEFERSLISERTRAGMLAARARGTRMGRKRSMTEEQLDQARAEITTAQRTVSDIAKEYEIHPRTLSRLLRITRQREPERHPLTMAR